MSGPAEARWRLRRGVRLQHDSVRNENVLLHPEGVLLLNDTAAAAVALCDGTRGVSGIANDLGDRYASVVPQQVQDLLTQLAQRRLLVVVEQSVERSEGRSDG